MKRLAKLFAWAILTILVVIQIHQAKFMIGSMYIQDSYDVKAKVPFDTIPLSDLTKDVADLTCARPLVPVHDRIVNRSVLGTESIVVPRKIPRILHITMKSRCLPPDLADSVFRWQSALPEHNVYFHDNAAVERLMRDDPWPEFPHLLKIFDACLQIGGAVTTDVWRNLVLYRYGGLYTDIDNWPLHAFTEDEPIMLNDSAVFFTNPWNRPSQWFMSMEAYHPIAYFNMIEILNRILAMTDISDMKPVFITGPDATKVGYQKVLSTNADADIYAQGVHLLSEKYGSGLVRKLDQEGGKYVGKALNYTMEDEVSWVDGNNNTVQIPRKELIKRQSGLRHWKEVAQQRKREIHKPKGSCWDRLYYLDTLDKNTTTI